MILPGYNAGKGLIENYLNRRDKSSGNFVFRQLNYAFLSFFFRQVLTQSKLGTRIFSRYLCVIGDSLPNTFLGKKIS